MPGSRENKHLCPVGSSWVGRRFFSLPLYGLIALASRSSHIILAASVANRLSG